MGGKSVVADDRGARLIQTQVRAVRRAVAGTACSRSHVSVSVSNDGSPHVKSLTSCRSGSRRSERKATLSAATDQRASALRSASESGVRLRRRVECRDQIVEELRRHRRSGRVFTNDPLGLFLGSSASELAHRLVNELGGALDESLPVRADAELETGRYRHDFAYLSVQPYGQIRMISTATVCAPASRPRSTPLDPQGADRRLAG